MVRAISFGEETYHTLDNYDTEFQDDGCKRNDKDEMDDLWKDEEELYFAGIPEALWHDGDLKVTPCSPDDWIDGMTPTVPQQVLTPPACCHCVSFSFSRRPKRVETSINPSWQPSTSKTLSYKSHRTIQSKLSCKVKNMLFAATCLDRDKEQDHGAGISEIFCATNYSLNFALSNRV